MSDFVAPLLGLRGRRGLGLARLLRGRVFTHGAHGRVVSRSDGRRPHWKRCADFGQTNGAPTSKRQARHVQGTTFSEANSLVLVMVVFLVNQ